MAEQMHFRSVVRHYQARVYGIAMRIVGDSFTAEEVSQDVFMALYKLCEPAADTLNMEDDHLANWLRRVAVHRSLDALKKRSRILYNAASIEEWMMVTHDESEAGNDLGANLERLVLTLPPVWRAIIILRYQEDRGPAEIAELLNMPVATVKSHLQRAVKMLRAKAEHAEELASRYE